MVTMDSDSASQDSDEGRRFRFEATRKDSNSGLDTRRARASAQVAATSGASRRRSRSREHDKMNWRNRDRRDEEASTRSRLDHRRRRESRDRSISSRENSRSARAHEKAPTTRNRDLTPKCDRRDPRGHESKRHRERFSPDKKNEKRDKFRDSGRDSLVRTRDCDNPRRKSTKGEAREARCLSRVDTRVRNSEKKDPGWKSETTLARDCEDLNLSDFEVVSDTEEHSSDASQSVRRPRSPGKRASCESDDCLKKRVSKQHYERLMRRQATKRPRPSRSESKCPEIQNGNDSDVVDGPSNIFDTETKRKSSEIEVTSVNRTGTIANVENFGQKDGRDSNWGPALPPKGLDKMVAREEAAGSRGTSLGTADSSIVDREHRASDGKSWRIVGPQLPENFRPNFDRVDDEDTFGPALPPHLNARIEAREDVESESSPLKEKAVDCADGGKDEKLTPGSDEDDDLVGPLPVDHPAIENDTVQQRLEMRARRLKAELAACDKEDEKKREEWMTSLPPVKGVNFGSGPRKFRARAGPDMADRSSWTDTPLDRARKRMERSENKSTSEAAVRNEGAREASAETEKSRKREKSLLEMHQKKLQKKKKKEEKEAKKNGKKSERRPFDRDVDLQANRFDEARKKNMFLKTAGQLDDRFSRGKI